LATGLLCVPNPLLPGWILLAVGLGIFFPEYYKRIVGKHVRTPKFEEIINRYQKRVHWLLSEKKNK
jgi:hypothetical protein